jgi:hypothetical protein
MRRPPYQEKVIVDPLVVFYWCSRHSTCTTELERSVLKSSYRLLALLKKTGLNRHRGVLSEKWVKKRVAKMLARLPVMPITIRIVCQSREPLHIGAAELPVRYRLPVEKEPIPEVWRPMMY